MNLSDTEFDLEYTPIKKLKPVKFHVEVIYQSEQVERYKLSAAGKWIILEKKIERQHSWKNWKVLDINYEIKNIDEWTMANFHHVYKLIDEKRFGRRIITYRPPHERNGWFDPERAYYHSK